MKKQKIKLLPEKRKLMLAKSIAFALCIMFMFSVPVYAAGAANNVVAGINSLKDLFSAIIAGVGAIIIIKGIMETAQGYQQQDSSGMNAGIKTIVAGGIMAAGGTLTALFL